MPFTFSHTVAAFLFKPWLNRLSLTGVVLGCMAPDFEYFLRMRMQGEFGHHIAGILLFDLPVSILIALVFHQVIRNEMIENLPWFLKKRFIVFQRFDWFGYFKNHYFMVIISIFLGIFTHITWDAFTHQTGFFVQKWVVLQDTVSIADFNIPLYKIFQHLSSSLGLMIIAIYFFKLPSYTNIQKNNERKTLWMYWGAILVLLGCLLGLWSSFNNDLKFSLVHVLVAAIACSFWSILIVSLFFKMMKNRKIINIK
ncbi:hypothetical protein B9T25_12835 [Acinetobacter sp. ANC 4470]|uniref:DUF4184 family protein n=1 Tax=Acinetobacter sp. ANC 4470 TaxID=1977881 RepID=UPI000A34967C|nr:DUF4184 family protein [Acinetobacter sp. ANC 4470]OTG64960.1 hypothetical protein B9T25_12835 [Acinetobacter sp. ANC 4470]